MRYRIFAALHGESNEGWVWLSKPEFKPRTLIRIHNRATEKTVFCEGRLVDQNFVNLYNERPHTDKISLANAISPLVIGDWYRTALGINEAGVEVNLDIKRAKWWQLPDLRAACQHPNPVVRLAIRLGVLSTWLGVLSLAQSFGGLVACRVILYGCYGLVGVLGVLSLIACRGVAR